LSWKIDFGTVESLSPVTFAGCRRFPSLISHFEATEPCMIRGKIRFRMQVNYLVENLWLTDSAQMED
jgi:hypothetical protein